jgi:O-acetyl-ADP-ribose deacetylase (regulator of RNase III)
MIRYVVGDATNPLARGPKIIAHICNDIGKWGKGFVMAVSSKWPIVRAEYLRWYKDDSKDECYCRLGGIQYVDVRPDICVANMVAQAGIHTGSKGPPIRYDALDLCLEKLAIGARKRGASIHMPRVGCGLAGGTWATVEPIVLLRIGDLDVTVYDLGA